MDVETLIRKVQTIRLRHAQLLVLIVIQSILVKLPIPSERHILTLMLITSGVRVVERSFCSGGRISLVLHLFLVLNSLSMSEGEVSSRMLEAWKTVPIQVALIFRHFCHFDAI